MQTPIAQTIALTCHGNAAIVRGQKNKTFLSNSTCQFCESVKFFTLKESVLKTEGKQEIEFSSSPDEWFDKIKARGAVVIRLKRTPKVYYGDGSWMHAAFLKAPGCLALNILYPNKGSESWIDYWATGNTNDPNKKIWRVKYALVSKGLQDLSPIVNLNEIQKSFINSLMLIKAFAQKHNINDFNRYFDKALETLNSKRNIKHGYHQDLIPAGLLSLEAETIIDACQSAWVFGGMGSWNDLVFEGRDQEEYLKVTDGLYFSIMNAIESSVNSLQI